MALQGEDVVPIRSQMEELGQVLQQVGSAVYSQPEESSSEAPLEDSDAGDPPEEGTVEGEYREL